MDHSGAILERMGRISPPPDPFQGPNLPLESPQRGRKPKPTPIYPPCNPGRALGDPDGNALPLRGEYSGEISVGDDYG